MSTTGTLLALALLVRGSLNLEFRAPVRVLWTQLLLPVAVVCFATFLDAGAAAGDDWPTVAFPGAVWLLFSNSVTLGGMVLWHERWLLRQKLTPAWLLLAAAALVALLLFGIHLSLAQLALLASTSTWAEVPVEMALAAGIAASFGLGTGIVAARLTALRPSFVRVLPTLLLASLVLTPVFYRARALGTLWEIWALANPLSVAAELGRAGGAAEADVLPRHAVRTACAVSGALLGWGLLTLRVPPTPPADERA